ncbi:MAG: uridine kinase [Anaerolineae bacterium]|nr:uridine kinase [Anaerolineae bacterium]
MSPFIIGVAGGTGSGKTTLSQAILQRIGVEDVTYIQHDSYYIDRSSISSEDRQRINYDHPDALENELLIRHLKILLNRKPIEKPIYDFKTHTRKPETERVEPKEIILLEGILIFVDPTLRALMDLKVFVDTDADVRALRRLKRDIEERGRTVLLVIEQYFNSVRPMHLEFVEPSKRYADLIVPEGGLNEMGVDVIVQKMRSVLGREAHRV